jgi:hypothetical protein
LSKATPGLIEYPDLVDGGAPQSAKAVLRNKRGISTSISESLGSIIIGVVVLAAVGVAIGAGYNYSQDSSAKSTLDGVKSAEVIYQGRVGSYGSAADLTGGTDPALSSVSTNLVINSTATNYCAIVKSASMFPSYSWITSRSGKVLTALPTGVDLPAGVTCPTTVP